MHVVCGLMCLFVLLHLHAAFMGFQASSLNFPLSGTFNLKQSKFHYLKIKSLTVKYSNNVMVSIFIVVLCGLPAATWSSHDKNMPVRLS